MQGAQTKTISLTPEELVFSDVNINTSYARSLTIQNNIGASIEIVFLLLIPPYRL